MKHDDLKRQIVDVTWTISKTKKVGYHTRNCVCGAVTPPPTRDQLIAIFEEYDRKGYLPNLTWVTPFDHFHPEGWSERGGDCLCGECTAVVEAALASRKVKAV